MELGAATKRRGGTDVVAEMKIKDKEGELEYMCVRVLL